MKGVFCVGAAGLCLALAAKTVTWNVNERGAVDAPTQLAAGDVLAIRGTNANLAVSAPVMGPKATVRGALGRPGSSLQKAVFLAPVEVDVFSWGNDYGEAALELHAPGNKWRRFELAYAQVCCRAPNVLAPEGALSWGGYYRGSIDRCATYDLGGFDQTVDRLDSTSSPGKKNSDHIYSRAGTLTMRGSSNAVCLARIDGDLSLVWDPKGDFEQAFDERANGTCGTIDVRRGRVRLGKTGSFPKVREIRVADGAEFVCESRVPGALASVGTVELGKGAKLKVTGTDPFACGETSVICGEGATVESAVPLALKRRAAADRTAPQPIADKLQVFWDDALVDVARTTAARVPHQPEFAGRVFTFDKPWEGNGGSYASTVRADGVWRMYRQIYNSNETMPYYHGLHFTLLESADGVSWKRRMINRYTVCGEKENNVLTDPDVNYWDNLSVFRDTNPACPPSERYKGVCMYDHRWTEAFAKAHPEWAVAAKGGRALWCLVSADGVNFRPGWKLWDFGYRGLRFDSLNVVFWDAARAEYRVYMRSTRRSAFERYSGISSVRWIKVAVSKDFRTWSDPEDITFDDGMEEYELYTNNVEPYPRNPELLVGFPTRYTDRRRWMKNYDRLCGAAKRRERMGDTPRHGLAITDVAFVWSRDGKTFRHEEDAFLTPGPEEKRGWLYGSGYPAWGLVTTPGRWGDDPELSLYVMAGSWGTAKQGEMNRYALRMDGFVSYHGRYRTEKLVTKRVVFTGDEMLVNFKTSGRGRMYVTLRDENGRERRTDELFGDKVDRVVDFENGSAGDFAGKPVTVTFELSDADIYSFRFRKRPPAAARAIDDPALAVRAATYAAALEAGSVSNLADAVRIPLLGALNMRYRATGCEKTLKAAQELYRLMCDRKRPGATDFAKDLPLFDRWLAVADAHFAIARPCYSIRSTCGAARPLTPLAQHYRWKYRHEPTAAKALAALDPAAKAALPSEDERFADTLACRAVGSPDRAGVASRLKAIDPTEPVARAEWLWAYWTGR